MKYHKTNHFQKKDGTINIYIYWYTTKSGKLKFKIEIYANHVWNTNGFTSLIAQYRTEDNSLLRYLKRNDNFKEV